MTQFEKLDMFAAFALKGLIEKYALLDRESVLGSGEGSLKFKDGLTKIAWEYAICMLKNQADAYEWLRNNEHL